MLSPQKLRDAHSFPNDYSFAGIPEKKMTSESAESASEPQEPGKSPEPLYRLTIVADADTMRQISQAFELQARVHLGQIDEVYDELEEGIYAAAKDQNLPVGSVGEGQAGREASNARWEKLMAFRDAIKPILLQAEQIWRSHTHRGPLEALRPWGNRRERVGYGLWKWMEHRLLHIGLGGKPADDWTRMTVHYPTPEGIAGGVVLTLETLEASNHETMSATEPTERSGTEFFRECLGVDSYRPTTMGKYEASNPVTIRRVFEDACRRAPEAADVIAALVFWEGIHRSREEKLAVQPTVEAQTR